MNNLFKVVRVLFMSFLLVGSFTACSDDDKDNDGVVDDLAKIENFSVTIVKEYSRDTYQYSWKGVTGAYSYKVFYRVKGTEAWDSSNAYTATNTPGQIMTATMMAGYGRETIYEMKIVAYRDTYGTIIAESDVIESMPLPSLY